MAAMAAMLIVFADESRQASQASHPAQRIRQPGLEHQHTY